MATKPTLTATTGQMAQVIGLQQRRLQALSSSGLVPEPKAGKWDVVGVVQSYLAYKLKPMEAAKDTLHDAKLRRERARARREEVEADIAEGKAVLVEDVKRLVGRRFAESRNTMYAATGTMALKVIGKVPPESKEILQAEVDRCYEQVRKLMNEVEPRTKTKHGRQRKKV